MENDVEILILEKLRGNPKQGARVYPKLCRTVL
jgi:hypothetical protein